MILLFAAAAPACAAPPIAAANGTGPAAPSPAGDDAVFGAVPTVAGEMEAPP